MIIEEQLKPVTWVGDSRRALADFPDDPRREVGFALYAAQKGGKHYRAKPLKGLGSGIYEIVADYNSDTYRAAYVVNLGDRLYVLHVFQKKSKSGIKTPPRDLNMIEQRLKQAKELAKDRKS